MVRVMLFDRFDQPLGELSENDVFGLVRRETVKGEHALEITTSRVLQQGWRILTKDGRGKWREHVVYGTDAKHETGERPIGTYYCVWSLMPDLMGTRVSRIPGENSPVAATVALGYAIEGTARWQKGSVTNTNAGKGSMYDTDGWNALFALVENWGGEIDATIEVGSSGVTARKVDLYSKQGDQTAKRRFDFGADLKSVRRRIADGPLYCRVTPRGKGEETDTGGYGRKITIESVNSGLDYLENSQMVDLAKLPNGSGGWEYPTLEIENPDCETPTALKAWAQSVLQEYTVPNVTYEVDVLQLAREGVDLQGVSLGDAVQIVDGKFGDLRIEGRVTSMTVNMIDERDTRLVIGTSDRGLSGIFGLLDTRVEQLTSTVSQMNGGTLSTADYLSRLLDRLNSDINGSGGYAYITEGQGIRCYDTAVSDPTDGTAEASSVVEIKGGTIRIANSKTAQGQWDWKTVFTSGSIAANLVTAVNVTAGYIGNAGGSYWDLDHDIFQIASTSQIGDRTVSEALAGIDATITNVEVQWAQNQSTTTAPSGGWSTTPPVWQDGYYIWQRTATTTGTGTSAVTSYSTPVCVSGKNGADGDDGVGIASIVPQYYLSTSNTTQMGGSWSNTQPSWSAGHYIWTRSYITWDDNTNATTTPVLAGAINSANQAAKDAADAAADAAKVATNYLTYSSSNGLDVGYSGTNAKTRISGSGVEVYDDAGGSAAFFGTSGGYSIARLGRQTGSGNVVMSSAGYVDVRNATTVMAHFGYGNGTNTSGGVSIAPYYDVGIRKASTTVGNYSIAEGSETTASGYCSHAEGYGTTASYSAAHAEGSQTTASGQYSHAEGYSTTASGNYSHAEGYTSKASGLYSHAEGNSTEATASYAHAEGYDTNATAQYAHAEGWATTASQEGAHAEGQQSVASERNAHAEGLGTIASGPAQHAGGKYNVSHTSHLLIIGNGGGDTSRSNAMYLSSAGALWIASTLTQNSDRRLKQHHAYLGDDASDFIRKLKPALFTKDGEKHLGFYAQDVKEADQWGTSTVTAQHTDESLDFDPLTLEYTALIAPLVAYAQSLEKRIEQFEARLSALEGGAE